MTLSEGGSTISTKMFFAQVVNESVQYATGNGLVSYVIVHLCVLTLKKYRGSIRGDRPSETAQAPEQLVQVLPRQPNQQDFF